MNAPSVYEQSNPKTHTVYVSGLPDNITEQAVLAVFVAFGDIAEIQMPREQVKEGQAKGGPKKLRGFAFVTYTSSLDAMDAINEMDLNFFPGYPGRVLKCNLARPQKGKQDGGRANGNRAIWASEDWLSKHGSDAPQNPDEAPDDSTPAQEGEAEDQQ